MKQFINCFVRQKVHDFFPRGEREQWTVNYVGPTFGSFKSLGTKSDGLYICLL